MSEISEDSEWTIERIEKDYTKYAEIMNISLRDAKLLGIRQTEIIHQGLLQRKRLWRGE